MVNNGSDQFSNIPNGVPDGKKQNVIRNFIFKWNNFWLGATPVGNLFGKRLQKTKAKNSANVLRI